MFYFSFFFAPLEAKIVKNDKKMKAAWKNEKNDLKKLKKC